ncbi:MAG: hypothetical protein ACM3X3_06870 [Betaproteobacteria bacterium]
MGLEASQVQAPGGSEACGVAFPEPAERVPRRDDNEDSPVQRGQDRLAEEIIKERRGFVLIDDNHGLPDPHYRIEETESAFESRAAAAVCAFRKELWPCCPGIRAETTAGAGD